ARRLGGEAHIVALSNQPGRLEIRIPSTEATGASLHERSDHMASLRAARGRSNHDEKMIVDVTTLDALATHEGPYFLKIDVEGAELDVLAGATRALASTAMVLAELSVFPRHNGEASFAQAVSFLDRAGFELFEIVELHQDGENGPLVFLDAAFVRKDFDIWSRVSQTPASRSP
ncbi:MAG: FkbM family methyltransferase, partial [Alphaproteobacteria bacterium]|nr:FkbM family methyltransferase [Alphaproteobacteria bacterium]